MIGLLHRVSPEPSVLDMATVVTLTMSKPFHFGLFPRFLHPVVCESVHSNQYTAPVTSLDEQCAASVITKTQLHLLYLAMANTCESNGNNFKTLTAPGKYEANCKDKEYKFIHREVKSGWCSSLVS